MANLVNMLDLSTGHMPETSPDFGSLRHEKHQYGYVVWAMEVDRNTPKWIIPILHFAIDNDCLLIHFDSDSPKCNLFTVYDW